MLMARIKEPHGCYYRAANILYSWGNNIWLANDLRNVIRAVQEHCDDTYVDDRDRSHGHINQYQIAKCSPFACPVNKPKWHDEYNWTILSGDGINDR